ncbi:MAG: bifunctional folylpolyglutamate synthase/dihydrofolate synthase [Candidatus Eisenbacteria bacterium]|nr:bifunctional folylpolyglutamate synthase/dihydrofolate synthase [Candidatus Eisenbacteria bacterium]
MTYSQAISYLYALEHGSVKLGLERIQAAVEARGHPERRYACVHVAGTNGKGSTCALIASILAASGYRTGLFTSPHLLDFRERLRVDGAMTAREEIVSWTVRLRPLIERLKLSFFEATTLLAFEIFAAHRVDLAVIEVGMGGRLDSTNVVRPALAVITGIDLDHTQSLGATRVRIAGEKAGIIKRNTPVLLGPCTPAVRRVFRDRAEVLGAPLILRERRARAREISSDPRGVRYVRDAQDGAVGGERRLLIRGVYQVDNALLAEEAAVLLAGQGWQIPLAARRRGLASGRWPGRFHPVVRRGRPPVVFDVAHNPQGSASLADAWQRWMPRREPRLILGMLGDKDQVSFLRNLRVLTGEVRLVALDSPRAGSVEALARAARRAGMRPAVARSMREAIEEASREGGPLLVTGSFLTVEAGMRALGMRSAARLFPPARPRGRGEARTPAPAPARMGKARA